MRIYNALGHRKYGDLTINPDDTIATIVNNAVTDAKLRNSAALSVIGRASNTPGDPADIIAASDGDVLRRSGATVDFGDITLRPVNFATPSGLIGLTAVAGTALTATRSDGTAALSQGIDPTWTGVHIFSGNGGFNALSIVGNDPALSLVDADATADNKRWTVQANSLQYRIFAVSDDLMTSTLAMGITRATTNLSSVVFPNCPVIFSGAGGIDAIQLSGDDPILLVTDTNAGVDNGKWRFQFNSNQFRVFAYSDDLLTSRRAIGATRSGVAVTSVDLGNTTDNTQVRIPDGLAATPALSFTNDLDTGIYRSAANSARGAAGAADAFGWDNNNTAGNTRLMIYDVDNGTLERVSVGAAGSGGPGFKVLRIPN